MLPSLAPTMPLTDSQKSWVLVGIGLSIFMSTLDVGIINVALPTLVGFFHTSFPKAQWAILGYQLVSSGLVLGATRLGDIWGKKSLYIGGLIVFTVSSLLCGLAPSIDTLIGFRILQGLGSLFISGLGLAIVTEVFPSSERGRVVGMIGAVVSLGIALGPSIGGLLLEFTGWRSAFLVNVPIGILAIFVILRAVPPSLRSTIPQKFDAIGAGCAMITLSCFACVMPQGQSQGFSSVSALALLSSAVINFINFLLWQARSTHPLLELQLFQNRQLSMGLLGGWLTFLVLPGTLLVTPFFLEGVMHYSTTKVGLLLAISPVTSGFIAPLAGALSDRYGSKTMVLVGLGTMLSGCLAISTLNGSQTDLEYGLRFLLFGIGLGLFRSPNDSIVMGAVPRDRLGIASGLLSLSRTSGVTVGVPLMGAVFAAMSASVAPGTDISTAPKAAIVAGFQSAFHLAAAIIAIAAITTAFGARQSAK